MKNCRSLARMGRELSAGFALTFAFSFCFASGALAQEELSEEEQYAQMMQAMEEFEASLDYQEGDITLDGVGATLHLDSGFRFLSAEDTRRLLEQAWGNPPGGEAEGAIVPYDFTVFGEGGWAVIITYEEDGYVSDAEAGELDYDALLEEMKADTREASDYRVEQGYQAIELVDWAETPYYDAQTHKLYWAKELRFEGSEVNTLNYNIRALGRRGVLVLNAVASTDEIYVVKDGMQAILPLVEFDEGSRYADFDPDVDTVAAYGIGALVVGKLAAKAGLIAKMAPLILVFKKFGIVIVIGVAAFARKLMGRSKSKGSSSGPPPIA